MKRPKPIDLDQIDLISLAQDIQDILERKLDTLDEGWNPTEKRNENEDILDDEDQGIIEACTEALYEEDKYWDYFNSKV